MNDTSVETPAKPIKPVQGLAKAIKIVFIIFIIVQIFAVIGSSLVLALRMSETYLSVGQQTALELLFSVGGPAGIISYLLCVIIFSVFSYRVVKNVHALGSPKIKTTPGWAVGWYFIPIAYLWKPYGVMEDMWEGAHGGVRYSPVATSMPFWWGCWITSNIVSTISARIFGWSGEKAVSEETLNFAIGLEVFTGILTVIAAFLLLRLVQTIALKLDYRLVSDTFD